MRRKRLPPPPPLPPEGYMWDQKGVIKIEERQAQAMRNLGGIDEHLLKQIEKRRTAS